MRARAGAPPPPPPPPSPLPHLGRHPARPRDAHRFHAPVGARGVDGKFDGLALAQRPKAVGADGRLRDGGGGVGGCGRAAHPRRDIPSPKRGLRRGAPAVRAARLRHGVPAGRGASGPKRHPQCVRRARTRRPAARPPRSRGGRVGNPAADRSTPTRSPHLVHEDVPKRFVVGRYESKPCFGVVDGGGTGVGGGTATLYPRAHTPPPAPLQRSPLLTLNHLTEPRTRSVRERAAKSGTTSAGVSTGVGPSASAGVTAAALVAGGGSSAIVGGGSGARRPPRAWVCGRARAVATESSSTLGRVRAGRAARGVPSVRRK